MKNSIQLSTEDLVILINAANAATHFAFEAEEADGRMVVVRDPLTRDAQPFDHEYQIKVSNLVDRLRDSIREEA